MLMEMSVSGYLDKLASKEPAPGGGTASAVSCAQAAALVSMVCELTLGREKYRDSWEELEAVMASAREALDELNDLAEKDARAWDGVMEAMRLPRSTEEEKVERSEAIEAATKRAAEVPLAVARRGEGVLKMARTAASKGNPSAITDAGVASILAHGGVRGAILNVRINLNSLRDRPYADEVGRELAAIEETCSSLIEQVDKTVSARMG